MSSYINLGPNVIGAVTVGNPPNGQPVSGEIIVAIDDNNAAWAPQSNAGVVDATSLQGNPISINAPSPGQILMENSTATGSYWQTVKSLSEPSAKSKLAARDIDEPEIAIIAKTITPRMWNNVATVLAYESAGSCINFY